MSCQSHYFQIVLLFLSCSASSVTLDLSSALHHCPFSLCSGSILQRTQAILINPPTWWLFFRIFSAGSQELRPAIQATEDWHKWYKLKKQVRWPADVLCPAGVGMGRRKHLFVADRWSLSQSRTSRSDTSDTFQPPHSQFLGGFKISSLGFFSGFDFSWSSLLHSLLFWIRPPTYGKGIVLTHSAMHEPKSPPAAAALRTSRLH